MTALEDTFADIKTALAKQGKEFVTPKSCESAISEAGKQLGNHLIKDAETGTYAASINQQMISTEAKHLLTNTCKVKNNKDISI